MCQLACCPGYRTFGGLNAHWTLDAIAAQFAALSAATSVS